LAIEGNTLSEDEVKDIIEGKTVIALVMEEPADYGNHSY
jgi:hypothetical protein